jgi:hypothetical protein
MSDTGTNTQPTVPAAGRYGAPTTATTVPKGTPTPAAGGSRVSPDLQNKNILTEEDGETYQYAIGVKGRKVFDKGKIVRYEGYKYFTPPQAKLESIFGLRNIVPGKEPLYFSGDEDKIYGMSVENLSSLQKAMNAIGLLGDNYAPGVADNSTRNAFANLLEQANGYGEDYDAAILRLASVGGTGRGRGSLSQYRVSNENDVKSIISRVSKQQLGRNLGEGDLNRLAQIYRGLEKEAGLAAASTTQAEVPSAPSVEVFTESQLGNMFPEETNARQFGSYLEAIKEKYQI